MKKLFIIMCMFAGVMLTACNTEKTIDESNVQTKTGMSATQAEDSRSNTQTEAGITIPLTDDSHADVQTKDDITDNSQLPVIGADAADKTGAGVKNRESVFPEKASPFMQPILQNPDKNSVTVMWFAQEAYEDNKVILLDENSGKTEREIKADRMVLSRVRGGKTEENCNDPRIKTTVYKYVAEVDGLPENDGSEDSFVNYCVESEGKRSEIYRLQACPKEGVPLKILLSSDHQIKNMCAANIEKVYETIGCVDAVFMDGDIVDVSDRAYDWFYADNAFFRVMTGSASDEISGKVYKGSPLLQNAPVFTAIGNHDVMGVYDEVTDLSVQFNYPSTREHAKRLYEKEGSGDKETFIRDHSYNTITYEEIFELPQSESGGEKYYFKKFGDIGLVTLDVSRVWRLPGLGNIGKYSEIPGGNEYNSLFGFGDFIFERVDKNSPQIAFLEETMTNPEYSQAKYKMAMFHSEAHSLGGNQIPAFTDPVAKTVKDPVSGADMVIYDYPIEKDYINSVITPILAAAETNLIFEAHSHLWNRFITNSGMNVLETSNVGNTYGGFWGDDKRTDYPSALNEGDAYSSLADKFDSGNYVTKGDPYGLNPEAPNVEKLPDNKAYLDSNTITCFSILNTETGTVDSYYFDTEKPDSEVVLFDSFKIVT